MLSSTIVVFPEPDTPVTTVRRPFGTFISRGFTVWIASVAISMLPFSNIFSSGIAGLSRCSPSPERNGPIFDS